MVFLIGIIGMFLRAFVLKSLWSWFVVPFGIVSISLPWAFGLSALASTLAVYVYPKETASTGVAMISHYVMLLLCLLVGYLAHRCM